MGQDTSHLQAMAVQAAAVAAAASWRHNSNATQLAASHPDPSTSSWQHSTGNSYANASHQALPSGVGGGWQGLGAEATSTAAAYAAWQSAGLGQLQGGRQGYGGGTGLGSFGMSSLHAGLPVAGQGQGGLGGQGSFSGGGQANALDLSGLESSLTALHAWQPQGASGWGAGGGNPGAGDRWTGWVG